MTRSNPRLNFLPPLRAGDSVALVAPAGAVDGRRAEGAVRLLESKGLRVRVRDDITARHRYLAGQDDRRAEELREALEAPGVRAVFLARGGYGTQRILGRIGGDIAASPRAVVGFSDNTALLNYLRGSLGWPVLHGPHPREEKPEELDAVLACLGYFCEPLQPRYGGLRPVGGGAHRWAEGEVAGGCLSLVASLVGTPFAVDCIGKILFLEDTREPAYRLDRMLHQLRASGSLEGAQALVFGRPETFVPEEEDVAVVEELLAEFAREVPFPVAVGLPCGHTEPNHPLPFGPRARLDLEEGSLTFLEALCKEEDARG